VDGVVVEGLDAALEGKTAGAAASGLKGRAAPGDLRPALAGQEFEVAVELKDAKRFVPAPLDAAFLKRHDFDDEAELRKDVRRRVLRMRERERDRLAEDRLVDLLVSKTEMALPADLVDGAVEGWARRRQTEGEAEGRDADEVAKETAASRDEVKARVEADLRRQFVLDRVCEAESVEVGEPELVGAVEQMARESGRSTSEVMAHFQEDPGRLAELRSHLRHSKAREALRRAAVVVEEAPPAAHA
jgi:FKBP-type peptidyl-prolyl cis-trans isomerase (trigger factor)